MAREKTRMWKVRMVASFQVIDHYVNFRYPTGISERLNG